MPNTETVIYYSPDPVLAAKAGRVFLARKIRVKAVGAAHMGMTLGALLGGPDPAGGPDGPVLPAPVEPLLVLSGFSRPRMDALFSALREAGVPSIDLKAVVTPTNFSWTLFDLCAELRREHAAMHGGA